MGGSETMGSGGLYYFILEDLLYERKRELFAHKQLFFFFFFFLHFHKTFITRIQFSFFFFFLYNSEKGEKQELGNGKEKKKGNGINKYSWHRRAIVAITSATRQIVVFCKVYCVRW